MFLSSTTGRFSVPTCRTAPRRAQEAVKAGRRPPPQAAQCGLDGREHGATLNQVGSYHPEGVAYRPAASGLPPAALFACHNGRKSHLDSNFQFEFMRLASYGLGTES